MRYLLSETDTVNRIAEESESCMIATEGRDACKLRHCCSDLKKGIQCLASASIALCCAAPAFGDFPRVEVPIKQIMLSNGKIRYAIPINIGGIAVDAWIDTGSSGLRILSEVVEALTIEITKNMSSYRFGSGLKLTGVIAKAVVSIDSASTTVPIDIQVIQSVECVVEAPSCPAARVSRHDFLLGGTGLPREGFKAIIGLNMAEADVNNPLNRIGDRSWIVELPKRDDDRPGKLIINPDKEDRSGFVPIHTDELFHRVSGVGGFHDAVLGCLMDTDGQRSICGPTLLDTGTQGISVISRQVADVSNWAVGKRMVMTFLAEDGTKFGAPFIAGDIGATVVAGILRPNQPRTRIMAGTFPYFAFSVLYDQRNGIIAFKYQNAAKHD
jgi:hypothetical protein